MQDLNIATDLTLLPEVERGNAFHCGQNIDALGGYTGNFEAALRLFDFRIYNNMMAQQALSADPNDSKGKSVLITQKGWEFLAARDGAMTIYHFAKTLVGIDEMLAQCPTLSDAIPREKRKEIRATFNKAFPNYVDVRDAVAHAGDKARNLTQLDRHGFTGDFNIGGLAAVGQENFTITDSLNGRIYTNTWEKKIYSYELSNASLICLQRVHMLAAASYLEGFAKLKT